MKKPTPVANAVAQVVSDSPKKVQYVAFPVEVVDAFLGFLGEQKLKDGLPLLQAIQQRGVPVELPETSTGPAAP